MSRLIKLLLSIGKKLQILWVVAFATLGMPSVYAVETVFWVDGHSGVAMSGYDPISYFLRGEGAPGSRNYEYFWEGAVWRFENEGNLKAFRDNPLTYAPQFGGFDATKMATNLRVTPDPRFSDLYNNRLYLFHSQKNLEIWKLLKAKHLKAAQNNWTAQYSYDIGKNFMVTKPVEIEVAVIEPAKPVEVKPEVEEIEELVEEFVKKPIPQGGENGHLDSSQRLGAAGAHFKKKQ